MRIPESGRTPAAGDGRPERVAGPTNAPSTASPQDRGDGSCLARTGYQEDNLAGCVQHSQRQGQPPRPVGRRSREYPTSGFVERLRPGEQGRCVAVGAEAQQDQVEARRAAAADADFLVGVIRASRRRCTAGVLTPGPEHIAQGRLVASSGLVRIGETGGHRVDPLGIDRHAIEQCAARHPVVAGRVVRRHPTLVTPEEVTLRPRDRLHVGWPREALIQALGRGATAERDQEPARAPPALSRSTVQSARRPGCRASRSSAR